MSEMRRPRVADKPARPTSRTRITRVICMTKEAVAVRVGLRIRRRHIPAMLVSPPVSLALIPPLKPLMSCLVCVSGGLGVGGESAAIMSAF